MRTAILAAAAAVGLALTAAPSQAQYLSFGYSNYPAYGYGARYGYYPGALGYPTPAVSFGYTSFGGYRPSYGGYGYRPAYAGGYRPYYGGYRPSYGGGYRGGYGGYRHR